MNLRKIVPQNRKGAGVVTSVVMGVGALVIGVIITFVIVTTLNTADLLVASSPDVSATVNESSDDAGITIVYANETTYSLANVNSSVEALTLVDVVGSYNQSGTPAGFNISIPLANISVNDFGVVTNATAFDYQNISISYNVSSKSTEQLASDRLIGNFTSGIDNVSSKIPTILLIVAVVFLFGALVLLVQQSRKMGIGDNGGSL